MLLLGAAGTGTWAVMQRDAGTEGGPAQAGALPALPTSGGATEPGDPGPDGSDPTGTVDGSPEGSDGETTTGGAPDEGAPDGSTQANPDDPGESQGPDGGGDAQPPVTEQEASPTPPVTRPTAQRPPPVPASIDVRIGSQSMLVGGQQAALATVLAAGGATLPASSYTLRWRSSDPAVLQVNPSGAVRAIGVGNAWLTAVAGEAVDSVQITTAVTLDLPGGDFSLVEGQGRVLQARATGDGGRPVQLPTAWSSSDPSVARVDAQGGVTAVAPGTATISVSAGVFDASVTVTVQADAPQPPSPEELEAGIANYLQALSAADTDVLARLWGEPDDLYEDLVELAGQRDFSAEIVQVGEAQVRGTVVTVPFAATGRHRTNFGTNRERDLRFRARFTHDGSAWVLSGCRLTEME